MEEKEKIKQEIVNEITKEGGFVSPEKWGQITKKLSGKYKVTSRTIRNYLKELIKEKVIIETSHYTRGKRWYGLQKLFSKKELEKIKEKTGDEKNREKVKEILKKTTYAATKIVNNDRIIKEVAKSIAETNITLKEIQKIETEIIKEISKKVKKESLLQHINKILEEIEKEIYFLRNKRNLINDRGFLTKEYYYLE